MLRPDDDIASVVGSAPRILYLTREPALMEGQLSGAARVLAQDVSLADDVSTDEITPAHACYLYDERIADYAYTGLRGPRVPLGAVRAQAFTVIVAGRSKGCGSSREVAPFAELVSGARLVVARSFEKIYRQNCHNIGLLTTTDFEILERLERGQRVLVEELLVDLDAISRTVVLSGGLLSLGRARAESATTALHSRTGPRPMTAVEKTMAAHARGLPPGSHVRPGDALFVEADVRFSHEYVTAVADTLFRRAYGQDARVMDPESTFLFRDHLTFLDRVMPDEHRRLGLLDHATALARLQEEFALRQGIRLIGEVRRDGVPAGSESICHNKMVEDVVLPGQIVVGTDSHTSTAGALGCVAFGVGSTDMAAAWFTKDVRVRVPETVRVVVSGSLAAGVSTKDVMLALLATPECRRGDLIGKVLEFTGAGLGLLPVDERATLANLAVEAGAFTAIVEVDDGVIDWLAARRGLRREEVAARVVRSDAGAEFAHTVPIDLAAVTPMIALPSDPRSGVPIAELCGSGEKVKIDIAYGGSCTGSKRTDIDAYAAVVAAALRAGRRVADGVRFYVQFGSVEVRRYASERGYLELFRSAGVELLDPSCGACIRAGPGVSERAEEVTLSAASRNFPGRSGPGRVYLASPLSVAAAAIAGHVIDPRDLLSGSS